MKILMTTDTVGGVWTYSLELCKTLEKYGVQVHLAAMGNWPTQEQQLEASALRNVVLYKSGFKLEWMENPWEDVEKARKWINCIYQTIQPDIVHLNNYASIEKDWTCPVLTVFHSCVQTWWQAVKGSSAPEIWDKYTEIVKSSLNASDVVVGPTNQILKSAEGIHEITSATRVIHNGRETFSSEEKNKEDIILCAGRIWDEAKNLKILSQIAKNLPWPIYIAGDDINPGTGEKLEIENVEFLGKLSPEEIRNWMERASIFISPTKYEPFGLAILEAAKSDCALVLSDLETLKEIWADSAIYFNPENSNEAEKALLKLIGNKEYRMALSKKSKGRSRKFTSQKMGEKYYDLYRKTIAKKHKRNIKDMPRIHE